MKDNFQACLDVTLRHEGGYVNDPHDPGGETNMGISKRSYPHENIKGMTRARAAQIYRRDFWDAVSGDDLPYGLDLVAFDAAVNSGVMRGAKWVQQALMVPADGQIGPKTIAKAEALSPAGLLTVISAATDNRMAFLKAQKKLWARYQKGWTRRVDDIEETALRMAREVPVTPHVTPRRVEPRAKSQPAAKTGWLSSLISAILKTFTRRP